MYIGFGQLNKFMFMKMRNEQQNQTKKRQIILSKFTSCLTIMTVMMVNFEFCVSSAQLGNMYNII